MQSATTTSGGGFGISAFGDAFGVSAWAIAPPVVMVGLIGLVALTLSRALGWLAGHPDDADAVPGEDETAVNPWLRALWAGLVLGVIGCAVGAAGLAFMLPGQRTAEEYAGVDWAAISIVQVLVLPASAVLLSSCGLAILAYAAARWQASARRAVR